MTYVIDLPCVDVKDRGPLSADTPVVAGVAPQHA
jgi:hypothetical protein